jgi:putative acetyltransferase
MLDAPEPIAVRPARLADALGIAGVHHAAVHRLAAGHYPPAVLERWAPPVSLRRAERLYRETQDAGGLTLVAETGTEGLVGFGIVVPASGEIAACYVTPGAARRGVGRQLLAALEKAATGAGTFELSVRASINARPFYSARGYLVVERGEHRFEDGTPMAVAFMRKDLTPLA